MIFHFNNANTMPRTMVFRHGNRIKIFTQISIFLYVDCGGRPLSDYQNQSYLKHEQKSANTLMHN